MAEGLLQRLVGAVVLIALGVIFWPIVFHDTARTGVDKTSQIPEPPAIQQFVVEKPQRPKKIEPVTRPLMADALESKADTKQQADDSATPSTSKVKKPRSKSEAAPGLDKDGLPKSWVVQVVSLSDASKAESIAAQLRKQGHKAYTKKVSRNGVTTTRVYVGPKLSLNSAEKAKASIDKQLQVKSMVVRYSPQSRPQA